MNPHISQSAVLLPDRALNQPLPPPSSPAAADRKLRRLAVHGAAHGALTLFAASLAITALYLAIRLVTRRG